MTSGSGYVFNFYAGLQLVGVWALRMPLNIGGACASLPGYINIIKNLWFHNNIMQFHQ